MEELVTKLNTIPDSYFAFVTGIVAYVKQKPERRNIVLDYTTPKILHLLMLLSLLCSNLISTSMEFVQSNYVNEVKTRCSYEHLVFYPSNLSPYGSDFIYSSIKSQSGSPSDVAGSLIILSLIRV